MRKILLLLIILFLVGCNSNKIDGEKLYKTIEGDLAMEFVNTSKAILIDVRTFEEFNDNHIEGAINIPVDEITKDRLKEITEDELDNIIVYCRSGNRSKTAAMKIIEYGYTNVYDLGSINNWG
jgi:rhodanese-related sulfurtransferase